MIGKSLGTCIIAETHLVYGFQAIIDPENSFIRINKIVMNNEGYQETPEEFAKKRKEAAKVDRKISTKIPHHGRGGAKKHAILNEFGEQKDRLNLSFTPTAKLILKEWAEGYGLGSSYLLELVVRSSKIREFATQELDLAGRKEKVEKLRQESRERPENKYAAEWRKNDREDKKKRRKRRFKK